MAPAKFVDGGPLALTRLNRLHVLRWVEMLAKFGNVVYWIASIVAALMLGCAGLVWFTERQSGDFRTMVTLAMIGLAVWIIGRGCRYVLAKT